QQFRQDGNCLFRRNPVYSQRASRVSSNKSILVGKRGREGAYSFGVRENSKRHRRRSPHLVIFVPECRDQRRSPVRTAKTAKRIRSHLSHKRVFVFRKSGCEQRNS